jgi:cell division protease FtsH
VVVIAATNRPDTLDAALAAVRAGAATIGPDHVDEALATVVLGPARRSLEVAERDRRITAWHEAGHALAGRLQADATDPVQVTIVPRGAAGGATWFPDRDDLFVTAGQARGQLVVALGGRAAGELHLGDDFTPGAAGGASGHARMPGGGAARTGDGRPGDPARTRPVGGGQEPDSASPSSARSAARGRRVRSGQ